MENTFTSMGLISGSSIDGNDKEQIKREEDRLSKHTANSILEFLKKNKTQYCLLSVFDDWIKEDKNRIRYVIDRNYGVAYIPDDIFEKNAVEITLLDLIDYLKKNKKYVYAKLKYLNENDDLKSVIMICDASRSN